VNKVAEKTIAAISTPLGAGGIGVVRISGEDAIQMADKVFRSVSGKSLGSLSGYTALFGHIYDGEELLDEAVATVFLAPKSYTGENVCELSCHGGEVVTAAVLRAVLNAGAVMAAPGEFTKRAFLNGKLDLVEAESVMGLISAKSDAQLRLSRSAHLGKLAGKIEKIEEKLTTAAASIAAYSDYPEEDIEGLNEENFSAMLGDAKVTLTKMLKSYDAGRVICEGVTTAIVGKPNVGKSTLMNMLSGVERSIVTDVAGTTRDIVEDTVNVGDIVLHLSDTAGIHSTDDKVEKIGVERADSRIDESELILAVFDCSKQLDSDDWALLERVKPLNTIAIINKSDIGTGADLTAFDGMLTVKTSAKNGEGYDELCRAIAEITGTANLDPDSAVLIGERQRACAERALSAVEAASEALMLGCTVDAVGVCVDDALAALFELTGKRVTNEVTNEIFRRFCVGK
jgi:tRNA modification GTPase